MKNNIIKFIFENKSYKAEIIEEQMDLFDKSYTIKSMVVNYHALKRRGFSSLRRWRKQRLFLPLRGYI